MGGSQSAVDSVDEYFRVFTPFLRRGWDHPRTAIIGLSKLHAMLLPNTVSRLLEENFSVLNMIEYAIHYIRFTMTEPRDMVNVNVDTVRRIQLEIALVDDQLKMTPSFDEELSNPVMAAYQDISSALHHSLLFVNHVEDTSSSAVSPAVHQLSLPNSDQSTSSSAVSPAVHQLSLPNADQSTSSSEVSPAVHQLSLLNADQSTSSGSVFPALGELILPSPDQVTSSNTTSQNFEMWNPFFSLNGSYSSEEESNFMKRLRHLYVLSRTLGATEIFQRLADICGSTQPDEILHSGVHVNTAIRTAISIIRLAVSQVQSRLSLDETRYNFLISYFRRLNMPPCILPLYEASLCYRHIVDLRIWILCWLLHDVCNFGRSGRNGASSHATVRHNQFTSTPLNLPVMTEKPSDGSRNSALWTKLKAMESVSNLIRLSEQQNCTICLIDDVKLVNFAILDHCVHLFCSECLKKWFKRSEICPTCRHITRFWTTREYFETHRSEILTADNTAEVGTTEEHEPSLTSSDYDTSLY